MKIATFSLFLSGASAVTFSHLLVNDTETAKWKYVRDVAPIEFSSPVPGYPDDYGKTSAIQDVENPALVCGRDAFASAPKTDTADVIAGETVGFRLMRVPIEGGDEYSLRYYNEIGVGGPIQVYLSKPTSQDLKAYKGDGDWFKIASFGALPEGGWYGTGKTSVNFTIPRTTPPGPYLMRIEIVGPSAYWGGAEFWVNCAQINVIGPGGGKPETAGTIKFPGGFSNPRGYQIEEPGLYINKEIWNGNLTGYRAPGPAVWTG